MHESQTLKILQKEKKNKKKEFPKKENKYNKTDHHTACAQYLTCSGLKRGRGN